MRRRDILAMAGAMSGAVLASPLLGYAQTAKIPTIGVLMTGSSSSQRFWETLRQSLNDLGYVEGQSVRFELRIDDGPDDRLADLADDLVKLKVDVIVALFTSATVAAKRATKDIPIVMVGPGDPVASGLVASLEQPGGNVTGTTSMASDLAGKCVEHLRQMLPGATRLAALLDANSAFTEPFLREMQRVGQANSMAIETFQVRGYKEIDTAFATMAQKRPDALIVQPSLPSRYVAELALKNKLPSASTFRVFAEDGGLMSYWVEENELFGRSARLVAEVLKGRKPAEIPVEPATKFELVLNRPTAKALGLTLPQAFLDNVDATVE